MLLGKIFIVIAMPLLMVSYNTNLLSVNIIHMYMILVAYAPSVQQIQKNNTCTFVSLDVSLGYFFTPGLSFNFDFLFSHNVRKILMHHNSSTKQFTL